MSGALSAEIERIAEEEARRIIGEAEQKAKQMVEEAKRKAEQMRKKALERKLKELEEEAQIELSLEKISAKKKLLDLKEEYFQKAFEEALSRVKEMAESKKKEKEYFKLVLDYLAEAFEATGASKLVVKTSKKAQELLLKNKKEAIKELEKRLGRKVDFSLDEDPLDTVLGVLAYTPDEKLYYNSTVETKLGKLKEEKSNEVMELLFPR